MSHQANQVSNAWVVNNTCYINNLDPNVAAGTAGSISSQNSSNTYFVDNISVSWRPMNPPYELLNASIDANFFTNLSLGGPCFFDATSTPPGAALGRTFALSQTQASCRLILSLSIRHILTAQPLASTARRGRLALDSVQLNRHGVCDFESNL